MSSFIILVNGIDDYGESKKAQNSIRTQMLHQQFPEAEVMTFDSYDENDGFLRGGYLRDQAKEIIKHLERLASEEEPQRIVWVAHNTGAALVKQVLLISSEEHRQLWIAFKTVAQYFVESPSYIDERKWEQYVLRLLATDRLPSCNLPLLLSVLPRALARIEMKFSMISHAIDTIVYGDDAEVLNDSEKSVWDFQDDDSKLGDIFLSIRASLRKNYPQLKRDYQNFQSLLARPDASFNRLSAATGLPKFITWLENHQSYKTWLEKENSAVLSITGPNGSGRTYLSSSILRILVAKYPDSKTIFLSYALYRCDIRRNSERSLIVSLIRQLLTLRPGFYTRVEKIAEQLSSASSISCQRLWALFRYLLTIPRHSRVFLVLNAADQCPQPIASKVSLLTTISSLAITLKIVVTSSVILECPDNVSLHSLDLTDAGWAKVVRSIAEERVSHIVNERSVWKDSQEAIVEKLFSGEYTYASVMLNLDVLAHSKIPSTKQALAQQLKVPILSIKTIFNTMVRGLEDVELAKQALNWIFHAVRPLTVSELAVALALRQDHTNAEAPKQLTFEVLVETVSWDLTRDLGDLLGPTVKIINERVYFAHHTFHDCLKNHSHLLIPKFHASITDWCLSYLTLCSEYTANVSIEHDSLEIPDIGVAAAFLEYSGLYWSEHYKLSRGYGPALDTYKVNPPANVEESGEVSSNEEEERFPDEKVAQFLTSGTSALKNWVEKCALAFGWEEDLAADSLFLATRLGLRYIVQHILQQQEPIAKDRLKRATRIAASIGNVKIVEDLLKLTDSDALVFALCGAAEYGQTGIIEFLLAKITDSGIKPSKSEEELGAILRFAAVNGHTAAFEVLLTNGYNMSMLDASNNTVVHLAALFGDVDTLLVMEKHKNENFKSLMVPSGSSGVSPLELSCIVGSIDTFELVLRSSSNERLRLDWKNSLQLAAEGGHVEIVKRLVTAREKVGLGATERNSWERPLKVAAQKGHYDVVVYLVEELEKTIAPNKSSDGIEADEEDLKNWLEGFLTSAIRNEKVKIAEFLVSKTERSPQKDRDYIEWAVRYGNLDILKVLKAAGVSIKPELENNSYTGILDIAIRENFVDIVSYLVTEKVTPQWDGSETSIHYAVGLGHKFCLRELLRVAIGEDMEREDEESNTPLDKAAKEGELDCFKLLLEWEKANSQPGQPWLPNPRTLVLAINGHSSYNRKECELVDFIGFLLENGWAADAPDDGQKIPLHCAVEEGDTAVIQLLLSKGARINATNRAKKTALHVAVEEGLASIADFLLEMGADPNQVDSDDLTPLHIATKKNDNKSVRALLGLDRDPTNCTKSFGEMSKTRIMPNVEAAAPDGSRALHLACKSSTITSTLLLLDPKPELNPELRDSKRTPLILAAINGSDDANDVIVLLLEAGADADAKDSDERTALHHLASHSLENMGIVRKMHKANSNVRMSDGSTPLYAAIRNGNYRIAKYLLEEANADCTICGGTLHSPLQAAAFMEAKDLVANMLNRGANPNEEGGWFGSPLHAAMSKCNLELIKLLLDNKERANASLTIRPFGTPLHALSSLREETDMPFLEIAKLLLKDDPEIINWNCYGYTPLMLAMGAEEEEAMMLLDLGADPNVLDNIGATALHYAAGFYSIALVHKLLEKDAKVELLDGCKRSPLYFAAMSTDVEKFRVVLDKIPSSERKTHLQVVLPAAVKVLAKGIVEIIVIEEGIDLNVPDRSGWTAMDLAKSYDVLDEFKILEDKGAKEGVKKEEPTEWCSEDRDGGMLLSNENMVVHMEAHAQGFDDDDDPPILTMGSIRANHPIPRGEGVFYFEVEILDFGLASESTGLGTLIGWSPGTWAYHSDDGSVLTDNNLEERLVSYGAGQIVGVAVNRTEKSAWFTLDGVQKSKVLENVVGQLYPAVSFQQGYSRVKVNFGNKKENSAPLKYEPEGGLRKPTLIRRRTVLREIGGEMSRDRYDDDPRVRRSPISRERMSSRDREYYIDDPRDRRRTTPIEREIIRERDYYDDDPRIRRRPESRERKVLSCIDDRDRYVVEAFGIRPGTPPAARPTPRDRDSDSYRYSVDDLRVRRRSPSTEREARDRDSDSYRYSVDDLRVRRRSPSMEREARYIMEGDPVIDGALRVRTRVPTRERSISRDRDTYRYTADDLRVRPRIETRERSRSR